MSLAHLIFAPTPALGRGGRGTPVLALNVALVRTVRNVAEVMTGGPPHDLPLLHAVSPSLSQNAALGAAASRPHHRPGLPPL